MNHVLRSVAFRVALVFAGALTLTTTLVVGAIYWQIYASSIAWTQHVLRDEAASARDLPLPQLQERLRLHLTQDLRRLDFVGLYDGSGKIILGNLPRPVALPSDGTPLLVHNYPTVSRQSSFGTDAIFLAQIRPDGQQIVLGRSLYRDNELASSVLHVFFATLVPVFVLAMCIATVVSRRAFRRLAGIQAAIGRVMAGELDVRLPGGGGSSDVGALVGAVNRMLDEVGRLIGQIRSVGDNIAHDLRAPLAVMRARLERGLAGGSESVLRLATKEALADLDRAMLTVTALLRISDLESGVRRGCFLPVDLAVLCRDAADFFGLLAEAKGVTLELEGGAQSTVFGDRDLLREALFNLVDNAVKFTPAGGRVAVGCGQGGSLLQVRDTGPGIPPEERAEICKRFFRSERTKDVVGLGLGLSITATIIDLHGFSLDVADACPGAIFSINARGATVGAIGMLRSELEHAVAMRETG